MNGSVYKICDCKDPVKCRHPWWFSYKRRGSSVRFRKSLDGILEKHVDSKTVAIEQANRLRRAIVDNTLTARERELLDPKGALLPAPEPEPVQQRLTVRQLLDQYKERHLSTLKSADRYGYQIDAATRPMITRPDGTAAHFGDWLVLDVSADALERLREARQVPSILTQDGRKTVTKIGGKVAANRDLRLLRAAWNWAIDVGIVDHTPFKRADRTVVKLTRETSRSRRLQPGEAEALLEAIDAASNTFLRALVEAAIETGCRRGELLHLQWWQVTLDGKRPDIWLPADKTKTATARRVPMSDRLKTILEMRQTAIRTALDLPGDAKIDGGLFVFGSDLGTRHGAMKHAWQAACERAKIDDLHFHDLRREAGSRWLEGGVELHNVKEWLGHTSIAQTSTYLATTIASSHAAMQRFDAQRGGHPPKRQAAEKRLTRIDTRGGTPRRKGVQFDTNAKTNAQKHSAIH